MSKIIFIQENSPEVRERLKQAGYSVCICAGFKDAIWLDHHPDIAGLTKDIHGTGYCDPDDEEEKYPPLERIRRRLKTPGWYSEDREFFTTVGDFLQSYPKPKE